MTDICYFHNEDSEIYHEREVNFERCMLSRPTINPKCRGYSEHCPYERKYLLKKCGELAKEIQDLRLELHKKGGRKK